MIFSKKIANGFLTQNSPKNMILDASSVLIYFQVVSATPVRLLAESARTEPTDRSDLLLNSMFQHSQVISINLIKMENGGYYRLLINKEPIQLKANNGKEICKLIKHLWNLFLAAWKVYIKKRNLRTDFILNFFYGMVVTKELFLFGKGGGYKVSILWSWNDWFYNSHFL